MASIAVRRRVIRRRREEFRRSALGWLFIAVVSLGAVSTLGLAAGLGTLWAVYAHYSDGYVPIEERIEQNFVGITEVYDRSGTIKLGHLSNPNAQLRDPVPLSDISPFLINATISTEDRSFYENPGINIKGFGRAVSENLMDFMRGDPLSGTGGSSITQQLVKTVYLTTDCTFEENGQQVCVAPRTVDRKFREIAYSFELEQDYTKDQILAFYLNQISYGDRYIGVQAAAQGYFRKDAKDLTLGEAALLAGIPQAPTDYHPRLNCSRDETGNCATDSEGRWIVSGAARDRQAEVLDNMAANGFISQAEADDAKNELIYVYPGVSDIRAAAWIDNQVQPRLVRLCEDGVLPKPEDDERDCGQFVASAGYSVTTTLDWAETLRAQQLAREWIADGLNRSCNCHNAAVVTIEPSTGQIKVYVPNIDPDDTTNPYVRGDIDQLTEINQPGSSFKPAVYLAWFDTLNKTPASTFWDTSPLNVDGVQIINPRFGGGGEGLITARAALGGSQNVPSFRAAYEAGIDQVIAMAKALGITTLQPGFDPTWYDHDAVYYGPSIATGGANIRAIDMAYMDATISNMGTMIGVPHHARELDLSTLLSTSTAEGVELSRALDQRLQFTLGNTRLPGSRELDPVAILEIRDNEGKVVFKHLEPDEAVPENVPQTAFIERTESRVVVDPGSVWLLHSIMSDCNARWIIWQCGNTNEDVQLDFFLEDDSGMKVPAGVKTGTQQGPLSADDTLETWVTGYSRYAATAVWVGNANNELVNDGPAWNYAAANTTLWLYKHWMGTYHADLRAQDYFDEPADFASLQPENVTYGPFESPNTEHWSYGGCDKTEDTWYRTDIQYESVCEDYVIDARNGLLAGENTPPAYRVTRGFVKLPELGYQEALFTAQMRGIPIPPTEVSTGYVAVEILSPSNGKTVSGRVSVLGSTMSNNVRSWTLELGTGSNPSKWKAIGSGMSGVEDAVLGTFDASVMAPGTYTIRLTVDDAVTGPIVVVTTVNVERSRNQGTPTPTEGEGDGGSDNGNGGSSGSGNESGGNNGNGNGGNNRGGNNQDSDDD